MGLNNQHKPQPSVNNRQNDTFVRPSAPQIAQMNKENPGQKVTNSDFDPEVKLNHFGVPSFNQPQNTVQARMKMGNESPTQQAEIIQAKEKVPVEEIEVPTPRIELGRQILQSLSGGLSIIFYEKDHDVFRGDATKWAKTHGAIGLTGNQINAENVSFGSAIPERLEIKGIDDKKRTLSIAEIISELGKLVEECVREAFLKDNGHEIDSATLNLAKFKTVALGSHGWDGYTSLDINESNIESFLDSVTSYLRNDINLVFYACTVSKDADEGYDQWMKVYNENDGEESLTAKARDKLALLGHSEGEVWGHTAVGHFLTNYTLRRFKVSDKGKAGESFLLYCFQDEINKMVADIVLGLQADTNYTAPIDEAKIEEIWDLMYTKTKEDYRACYSSANNNLRIKVGGEEERLAEEAPMYPEEVKKMILEFRESQWTKKFDIEVVKAYVVKNIKAN
ncbi:MAG: hypothetical protein ACJAUD_000971 [Crocinitomicaceae bacterium]|jgi:hypothetical protein